MRFLSKLAAHKLFAWFAIVAIGVWFLVVPIFTGDLGANPIEKLLHRSGEMAIWTLGAVLSLTPLRVLFPNSSFVASLNRHRRLIGVSAFVYGLIHFTLHLLYEGDSDAIARSFAKPFIWFGLGGLTILFVLAITSNKFAIRLLGRNWKRLHRIVYGAAALLLYHQAIAGKGHWRVGRWLVFSLVALQIARITKKLLGYWRHRPLVDVPSAGSRCHGNAPPAVATFIATQ